MIKNPSAFIRNWQGFADTIEKTKIDRCIDHYEARVYDVLAHQWDILARHDQMPPDGDWSTWLMLGGRGAGKTRAGAEWVNAQAGAGAKRIALVAPTYNDAREVMIEGESGLLNLRHLSERPEYVSSRRRLEWPNGSVAYVFSAQDPDSLRGPQFDCAWADEFCAWEYPRDTLSNLRFGLRIGKQPRLVITTTPKPILALKTLMSDPLVIVTRAKTMDNADNLSPAFMEAILSTYEGTRVGRQELNGEILDDHPGALWSRDLIEASRMTGGVQCDKIIIAVDPPVSSGRSADACGLIVVGVCGYGRDATGYVLQDASLQGTSPEVWAGEAIRLWDKWGADYVLAEVNQGGELIKSVFAALDSRVPVRSAFASKSKTARAQPVLALYERGRVKHVGAFPELEDEMCMLGAPGLNHSPDRVDAMVWGLSDLMLSSAVAPRVRTF